MSAEASKRSDAKELASKAKDAPAKGDEAERELATLASRILPLGTIVGAIGVGILFGPGPALLVLAAGTLMSVVGLFWASIRTLAGDAPLADGLAEASTTRALHATRAEERKKRVLRALKDLELEHSVGKIDDADFANMSKRYREQAKAILKEIDVEVEPLRERAEKLARAHLKKVGLARPTGAPPSSESEEAPAKSAPPSASRVDCATCGTSNDADAAFCKKCGTRVSPETESTDATA